jgi:hypothetical protein
MVVSFFLGVGGAFTIKNPHSKSLMLLKSGGLVSQDDMKKLDCIVKWNILKSFFTNQQKTL